MNRISINICGLDMSGKTSTAKFFEEKFCLKYPGAVKRYRGRISNSPKIRWLELCASRVSERLGERGLNLVNLFYAVIMIFERGAFRKFINDPGIHISEGRWERSIAFNHAVASVYKRSIWEKIMTTLVPEPDSSEIAVLLQCSTETSRIRAGLRSNLSFADRKIASDPVFSKIMRGRLNSILVERSLHVIEFDSAMTSIEEIYECFDEFLKKFGDE